MSQYYQLSKVRVITPYLFFKLLIRLLTINSILLSRLEIESSIAIILAVFTLS